VRAPTKSTGRRSRVTRRILSGENARKPLPANRDPSLLERATKKDEPPDDSGVGAEKDSREVRFLEECELKSSTRKAGIK
jgi:hypothetical protein